MMDKEAIKLNDEQFIAMKLNKASREELIDLIYKLRNRIKELTSKETQSND